MGSEPMTPAGRIARIEWLLERGHITRSQAVELLCFPSTARLTRPPWLRVIDGGKV